MREFSRAAVVIATGSGALRIILKSPTGEQVYHTLSPGEAQTIRETLTAALPAAEPQTVKSRKSGKET